MAAKDSTITTLDDAPKNVEPPAAVVTAAVKHDEALSGEMVELEIHQGEGEIGKQAVFVGLNGNGYQIPRGIKSIVPIELVHILDNARQTVYESGSGATSGVGREVNRFSYNTRAVAIRA